MVGMFLFGGRIKKNLPVLQQDTSIPDTYHLDNFNDILSSFVTLFGLMVVNNWMVHVQLYCEVMGSKVYRIYFCLFFYFSVIVGINIIVAFSIDMYASIERLDQDSMKILEVLEEEFSQNLAT